MFNSITIAAYDMTCLTESISLLPLRLKTLFFKLLLLSKLLLGLASFLSFAMDVQLFEVLLPLFNHLVPVQKF